MDQLIERILAEQDRNPAYTDDYLRRDSMKFKNLQDICDILRISTTDIVDDSSTPVREKKEVPICGHQKKNYDNISNIDEAVSTVIRDGLDNNPPSTLEWDKNKCYYSKTYEDGYISYCHKNVSTVIRTPEGRAFCDEHRCNSQNCCRMAINKREHYVNRNCNSDDKGFVCYSKTGYCKSHQQKSHLQKK